MKESFKLGMFFKYSTGRRSPTQLTGSSKSIGYLHFLDPVKSMSIVINVGLFARYSF